jgi:DNA-binding MarR family transcriptional regulator
MNNQTPFPKIPLKGELLRRIAQLYPELDADTIAVITYVQSISRALSADMNRKLAGSGLTEGKFYVLAYLWAEELLDHEAPSPSQIADNVGVTRGTITGLLDGLEREQYVERQSDSRDRRALTIRITDKARQFMTEFTHAGTLPITRAIPLDTEEKRVLVEWLSQIAAGLEKLDPPR